MRKCFLLLALLFILAACNAKEPTVIDVEKAHYTAETLFRTEDYEWLSSCYAGACMYDIGKNEKKNQYELWKYDCEQLNATKTSLFPKEFRFVRYVHGFIDNGKLHTLCGTLSENGEDVKDYFLCEFDAEGNVKSSKNLTKAISHIMEHNDEGFHYSYVLPGGRVLIFSTDSGITTMHLLSDDGNVITERKLGELDLFDCQLREDGKILLLEYHYSGKTVSLSEVDVNSGKRTVLIRNLELPYGAMPSFVCGYDPELVYFKTSDAIWQYDIRKNELSTILIFEDSMLNGGYVGETWQRKDGGWCLYYLTGLETEHDFSTYVTDLVLLKESTEPLKDKIELTYAVIGPENLFKDDARAFNLSQDQIKINVKIYENEERFLSDIISGNVPDLVNINDPEIYKTFCQKGMLEDIRPYLSQDTEISEKDFLPKALEFYEVDGKIFAIPYGLIISAMMGDEQFFENMEAWNFTGFKTFLNSLSVEDKNKVTSGCSNQEILFQLCYNYMDQFIDPSMRSCDFQNEEFMSMLEVASCFSKEVYDDDPQWEKREHAIETGESVLETIYIGELSEYESKRARFPHKGKIIGFPSDQGDGISIMSGGIAPAMLTGCRHKSVAWDFIKYTLTKEKNSFYTSIFPTYKPVFQDMLDEARANAGKVYSSYYGDEKIEIPYAEQAEIDQLQKLLNDGYPTIGGDTKVLQIICEEADGFFQGSAGLEDVVDRIQNRVTLYLEE